jgi:hypothetical protein
MLVAFAAVALVAAGPAFAGGDRGQIEIGGYGGWFFPDDYGPFHPDKDNIWGGRLGYWFTQNWTLEGSYQKVMTDTEMNIIGQPEVDVDLASYRLNLLYNLGSAASKARLFVTAGAGSEKTDIDTFVDENKFGWNVGGGLRFFLSRISISASMDVSPVSRRSRAAVMRGTAKPRWVLDSSSVVTRRKRRPT